ncbi:cell death abnormality protein 1-like [Hetaerina americana]|uniref:cell death abnormality protein 1-like n=1 Tax=Hetaerina americana TaxID=62018 RepID=UPI003A7F1A9C
MTSSSFQASAVIIVLSWQLIHGTSCVPGKSDKVEDNSGTNTTATPINEKEDPDQSQISTENANYMNGSDTSPRTVSNPEEISNQNEADWEDPCILSGNGFFPNYTSSCQQYYRCENHRLISTHTCRPYTAFSTNLQDCVNSMEVTCVEPLCPAESPGLEITFITPGTQCRAYHFCGPHGQRGDYLCAAGYVYDRNTKKCVPTPWMCREPICTGRVDGNYADSSEDCRRSFCCRGGHLTSVAPCPQGHLYGPSCLPENLVACPPPSTSAAPILVRGPPPIIPKTPMATGPCSLLRDGLHRNFSADACRHYYRCTNGKVTSNHACPPRTSLVLLPPGDAPPSAAACLASTLLVCLPLRAEGRPPCGPVAGSKCGRKVECEAGVGGRAILLACPEGRAFDGHRCAVSDGTGTWCGEAPQPSQTPCAGKSDGYHPDPGSPSCRGYVYCGGGHSISYICPRGFAFDGERCAPADEVDCPSDSPSERRACAGIWAGYVADHSSGCQSYFYCQAGDRITTLSCPRGHMFDGRRCVPGSNCSPDFGGCESLSDGYYPDLEVDCRGYFRCAGGFRIEDLVCPDGRGFDGRACVDHKAMNCSRHKVLAASSSTVQSPCQAGNGFFQDFESGCRRYYFCIDGERTWLSCQGDDVFDGQLCVPAGTYSCPKPPPATMCTSPNCSSSSKFIRVTRVFTTISGKGAQINSLGQSIIQKTTTTIKVH